MQLKLSGIDYWMRTFPLLPSTTFTELTLQRLERLPFRTVWTAPFSNQASASIWQLIVDAQFYQEEILFLLQLGTLSKYFNAFCDAKVRAQVPFATHCFHLEQTKSPYIHETTLLLCPGSLLYSIIQISKDSHKVQTTSSRVGLTPEMHLPMKSRPTLEQVQQISK
jgi:hypothetical protein